MEKMTAEEAKMRINAADRTLSGKPLEQVGDIDAKLEKVQLEPGDILLLRVPGDIAHEQVARYTEHLQEAIRRKLGLKSVLVVPCVGEADLSVVKRNELSDIYQRLDNLEKEEHVPNLRERLDALESEVLYGGK